MTIQVRRLSDNLYQASAVAPVYRGGQEWSPSEPMDGKSLVEELMRKGFHLQDIVDAMSEADPNWAPKMGDTNC